MLSLPVEALSVLHLQPVRQVLLWMSVSRSWSSYLKIAKIVQKREWLIQTSLMMKALRHVSRRLFAVYFTVLIQWCQVKDRSFLYLWSFNCSSSQKAWWSPTSTTSSRGKERRWGEGWRGGDNLRVYGIQVPSSPVQNAPDSWLAESDTGVPFPIQHWSLHRWDL